MMFTATKVTEDRLPAVGTVRKGQSVGVVKCLRFIGVYQEVENTQREESNGSPVLGLGKKEEEWSCPWRKRWERKIFGHF